MNDPTNISILKNSSFITTYIEIRFQNLKIRNYLILRWKKNIFNFIISLNLRLTQGFHCIKFSCVFLTYYKFIDDVVVIDIFDIG